MAGTGYFAYTSLNCIFCTTKSTLSKLELVVEEMSFFNGGGALSEMLAKHSLVKKLFLKQTFQKLIKLKFFKEKNTKKKSQP